MEEVSQIDKLPEIQITNTTDDKIQTLLKKNKQLEDQLCLLEERSNETENSIKLKDHELAERISPEQSLQLQIEDLKLMQNQKIVDQGTTGGKTSEILFLDEKLKTKEQEVTDLYQVGLVLIF